MMDLNKTFKTVALTGALCTGLAAMPAVAGTPIVDRQIDGDRVSVMIKADYLDTDIGVKQVYKALKAEAADACEVTSQRKTARKYAIEKTCTARLLTNFVDSTDSQALSRLHRRSTSA